MCECPCFCTSVLKYNIQLTNFKLQPEQMVNTYIFLWNLRTSFQYDFWHIHFLSHLIVYFEWQEGILFFFTRNKQVWYQFLNTPLWIALGFNVSYILLRAIWFWTTWVALPRVITRNVSYDSIVLTWTFLRPKKTDDTSFDNMQQLFLLNNNSHFREERIV